MSVLSQDLAPDVAVMAARQALGALLQGGDLEQAGPIPDPSIWPPSLQAIARGVIETASQGIKPDPQTVWERHPDLDPLRLNELRQQCYTVENLRSNLETVREAGERARLLLGLENAREQLEHGIAPAVARQQLEDLLADRRPDAAGLRPHRASEWAGTKPPPREWAWRDWLPLGSVTGFGGPGGSGKSTAAQQLCTHGAVGQPFLGEEIPQGPALYITCEDSADELHRRQLAINAGLGVSMDHLRDLHLISRVGQDSVLVDVDGARLIRTPLFYELDRLLGRIRPRLVVLDLVPDFWTGREIDRQQVNAFVKTHLAHFAQRYNLALVTLYHPSAAGVNSGTGTSGSTAWEGSFRSRLYLDRADAEDLTSGRRVLKRMKANYASLAEHELVWRDGCFSEQVAPQGDARQEYFETAFLSCLQWCGEHGREVSPSPNSPVYYGRQFPELWQQIDRRHRKVTQKQFEKAFMPLVFRGAVEEVADPRNQRGARLKFVGYGS